MRDEHKSKLKELTKAKVNIYYQKIYFDKNQKQLAKREIKIIKRM